MTPDKMSQQITLPVLEEVYPRELVCQVLQDLDRWEQRERKLNHVIMVSLLIAWTLLPTMALKRVWSQLSSALRWLSQQAPAPGLPGASALCYRRRTLGVGPLRRLMRLACQPLCEPSTPGAFCFGRRLIAIDSKLFDLCETRENDWTFRGRSKDDQPRTHSPFPHVRLLSVLEMGSHAHVGAALAPGFRSEMALVPEVVGSLPANSLVLQDSGFRGAWWIQRLQQAGHDSITRLQADDYTCQGERLWDGSYLVQIQRSQGLPRPSPLTLRIIEYRLDERIAAPLAQLQRSRGRSGTRQATTADQVYRLATTLLDPLAAPAKEVAACYHERWELELVDDEGARASIEHPGLAQQDRHGRDARSLGLALGPLCPACLDDALGPARPRVGRGSTQFYASHLRLGHRSHPQRAIAGQPQGAVAATGVAGPASKRQLAVGQAPREELSSRHQSRQYPLFRQARQGCAFSLARQDHNLERFGLSTSFQ